MFKSVNSARLLLSRNNDDNVLIRIILLTYLLDVLRHELGLKGRI